jgi:hypothetical protein
MRRLPLAAREGGRGHAARLSPHDLKLSDMRHMGKRAPPPPPHTPA